jgi:hypothetical protein
LGFSEFLPSFCHGRLFVFNLRPRVFTVLTRLHETFMVNCDGAAALKVRDSVAVHTHPRRRSPKRLRSSAEGLAAPTGIASDQDESDDAVEDARRRLKVLSPIYQNGVALPLRRDRTAMRPDKLARRQFHVLVDRHPADSAAPYGVAGARKLGLRDRMEDAVRNAFQRSRKRKREHAAADDNIVHLPMRRTRSSVRLAEEGQIDALEDEIVELDRDDDEFGLDSVNGAVDEDPGKRVVYISQSKDSRTRR